jgi:hypothetical protein
MSAGNEAGPAEETVYEEPGSTWWPLLWGPVFAVIGVVVEALTGPVHWLAWFVVSVGMAGATAIWVHGRRSLCSVRLTRTTLRQGREEIPVARIAEVDAEAGPAMGARVLGGGWTVPKKFEGVAIKLDDGTDVLGWAMDGESLRAALRQVVAT